MAIQTGKHDRWWAGLIGTGLALSPIHNAWIHNTLFSNANGEWVFFIPWLAYLLIIYGSGMYLVNNWKRIEEVGLGGRVFCLLVIIVIAIGLANAGYEGVALIAPACTGLSFLALYLSARILGKRIFLPVVIGAVIASVGVLIAQIIHPGKATGGLVFEQNYNIVVGYVLLGAALFIHRWRWVAATLAVVAMIASGSPEAVLPLAVVGIAIIWRKDYGWRLPVTLGVAILAVAVLFWTGYGQQLLQYPAAIAAGEDTVNVAGGNWTAFTYRWHIITTRLGELTPLGAGYSFNDRIDMSNTIHNTPFLIIYQLGYPGIMAALAWLGLCVYGVAKTSWKYAWLLMIALSIFDNFTWTMMAPFFWALAGVSTVSVENDLIFRRNNAKTI